MSAKHIPRDTYGNAVLSLAKPPGWYVRRSDTPEILQDDIFLGIDRPTTRDRIPDSHNDGYLEVLLGWSATEDPIWSGEPHPLPPTKQQQDEG